MEVIETSKPDGCTCCWHYAGDIDCSGVDCQRCENCDLEED
jgi:hypothetical protein